MSIRHTQQLPEVAADAIDSRCVRDVFPAEHFSCPQWANQS